MRPNCCHFSLAFVLKFLNFLQAFVGFSILLYSIWMLNQWDHHIPQQPPPLPHFSLSLPRSLSLHFTSSINLPPPWYRFLSLFLFTYNSVKFHLIYYFIVLFSRVVVIIVIVINEMELFRVSVLSGVLNALLNDDHTINYFHHHWSKFSKGNSALRF